MKTFIQSLYLILWSLTALSAHAQLTATVHPGYVFGPSERPTTGTLNLLGQPTISISGTISGTVGLAGNSITGDMLVNGFPDNITLDYNGASPRQIEIKAAGVGTAQISTSIAGAGLTGGAGSALKVNVDGTSLIINTNVIYVQGLVGSVTAFAGAAAPSGWIECDGSAISRVTYSNLFSVIGTNWGYGDLSTTFNVPDLRGEFIRGYDHGRGVDLGNTGAGRTQYSTETNNLQNHIHYLVANADGSANPSTTLTANNQIARANTAGSSDNLDYLMAGSSTAATLGQSSNQPGGVETRPRNVVLLYVIKW